MKICIRFFVYYDTNKEKLARTRIELRDALWYYNLTRKVTDKNVKDQKIFNKRRK